MHEPAQKPTVVVGKITRSHGIRGEVAVAVVSDNPGRFAEGAVVFLEDGTRLTVRSTRPHGGRLLVLFEETQDRARADLLRDRLLVVPESMLPDLPEGEWWPHRLEGCEVFTEAGRALGRLVQVIPNPANDLWVTHDDGGAETLVPALRSVIVSVDIPGKRVVVREIPGLTAPEASSPP